MAQKKLTASQQRKLEQWKKDGFTIGTNTAPIDESQAEKAIVALLKEADMYKNQKFLFFPSIHAVKNFLIENNSKSEVLHYLKAQTETCWISFYLCCEDIFKGSKSKTQVKYKDEDKRKLLLWDKISKTAGWWWPFENYVLMSDRPREIHFETDVSGDETPRLHKLNGPAVSYSDGSALYVIRGVTVTKEIAEGNFTAKDILAQTNQEVKRCMIDMFTPARLIQQIKAKVVNEDSFGILYSANVETDEEIYMVKVTDATPQRDGTFKEYWLSVDPKAYGGLKTAHAAVASTWRRKDGSFVFSTPEEYNPMIQT